MIIAGTGHRPEKLGGYGLPARRRLYTLACNVLGAHRPALVVSGVAQGWDMALAAAAISMGFPLQAAVPFEGQESRWPEDTQARYRAILERATDVVIVSPGGYKPSKFQARDEWMVEACDELFAVWDGSASGTKNTLDYAEIVGKPYRNFYQAWKETL
jgi:uncharacterized phage-like protein YoqJ